MRVVFLSLYDQAAHGLRCVAANALRAGHEVQIICFKQLETRPLPRDEKRAATLAETYMPTVDVVPSHDLISYPLPPTEREMEILFERIERFGAEVAGLTLSTDRLPFAQKLSRELRRRFPRMRQVWGGIHATMDPVGALECADAVCVGEGDEAFVEYLADPQRTDIQNFYFKDSSGAPIVNPLRPLIQNLDSLPPPLYGERETLIEGDREVGTDELWSRAGSFYHIVLTSQRGCPFSCSYCLHCNVRSLYPRQKYLRRKSVDYFLDEVELRVRRLRPPRLVFWDEIFAMGREWIDEFCDKYPARIGLPFWGYAHPGVTTLHMLQRLKEAGCESVGWGIQSGSVRIAQDFYNRHTTTEAHLELARIVREAGFDGQVTYDLMTSCPFEREEDLQATVRLLAELPKSSGITVKRIVLFPFTDIAKRTDPRVDLDDRTYLFYDMLYLTAAVPGFPPKLLTALMEDRWLRDHPEALEKWLQEITGLRETNDKYKLQFEAWKGEIDAFRETRQTLEKSVETLNAQMPWGVRRALRHLFDQAADSLRRLLRRGGTDGKN